MGLVDLNANKAAPSLHEIDPLPLCHNIIAALPPVPSHCRSRMPLLTEGHFSCRRCLYDLAAIGGAQAM
jgi:hypothetical protein